MDRLVSVIIPTFGDPVRLTNAIDSVLAQDYKTVEIIVVDDNGEGTEYQIKTQKIIDECKNVKYICHRFNKNGSAARNTGISVAEGYYIALLDMMMFFCQKKLLARYKK